MLALTIREKNGEERQLIFDKEEVTIGRATGSDIVLPRSNISKRHARLVDKHDKVVIVDLRSTNGTYVNGRRITAPELLTYDDKVYIGDFVIRLSRPAEQHPSQRMTAPYSASPTPMGDAPAVQPRSPRAATVAVDPPAPEEIAEYFEEELAPPAEPPAFMSADVDDDASTRAIDSAMVAAIDDEPPKKPAPPAPAKKAAPPGVEMPAPRPPAAPAAKKETAPPPAPLKKEAPAPPPPKKDAARPAPKPAASAPVDDGATVMSLAAARRSAPEPEPEDDDGMPSDASVWGEWNGILTLLVGRIELDHPDGLDPAEAQDIVEGAIAAAIDAGEVAPETDRDALLSDVLAEVVGLGPLTELEADPTVRMVVANGPKAVFVDRGSGVLEPNGRLFATSASYRKALALLAAGGGHMMALPPDITAGVEEVWLPDGSSLRLLEAGLGADPLFVWRRPTIDAPQLAELVADRFLDQAQERELTAAVQAGKNIVIAGAHAGVLASALASAWGAERRVVAIGDGTRVALTQTNVARVGAASLCASSDLIALEPDGIVFEQLDGRVVYLWVEAALTGGRPIIAVSNEQSAERALKRLAMALELHGLSGRGAALVGEAVDLAITVKTEADGQTRIDKIDKIEAQKDGYALESRARR